MVNGMSNAIAIVFLVMLVSRLAGWQVFADLVIACLLLLMWIFPDARKRGRNPWGYALITVVLGAFGPLLYWALGKSAQEEV